MSNLIKSTEFLNYPLHMQKYLINKYSSKCMNQGNVDSVKNALKDLIIQMIAASDDFVKREMSNPKSIYNLRDDLYNDCIKRFPALTYKELQTAFSNGVKGDYEKQTGKLHGIPIANINRWINCYLNSHARLDSIRFHLAPKIDAPKIPKEIVEAGIKLLKESFIEPLKKQELEERKQKSLEKAKQTLNQLPDQERNWFELFEKFWIKKRLTTGEFGKGARYIERYNKHLTLDEFMRFKANQRYKIQLHLNHKIK